MIIYEEILRDFQEAKVRYILVGGIAVNLYGYLRATADLDILVDMKDENLAKLVRIMKKHGYRVKQPIDPMGIANKNIRTDWIKNKNMKAFNFYKENEFKEVDIIIESPVSYDRAKGRIKRIKIENITLPVIDIDDLIKMKRKTTRSLDKIDIEKLRMIKRLRKK